jgi:hypothetical protein
VLYGYAEATGHLYTIDTTTLHVASDVGTNPALSQFGDLAGFSPNAISGVVPEPSGLMVVTSMLGLITCCSRKMRSAALMQCGRIGRRR